MSNVNWTHLPPDDIDNLIRHAKAHGFVDKQNTIRIDFDDLCNLLRKLQAQSAELKVLKGQAS